MSTNYSVKKSYQELITEQLKEAWEFSICKKCKETKCWKQIPGSKEIFRVSTVKKGMFNNVTAASCPTGNLAHA